MSFLKKLFGGNKPTLTAPAKQQTLPVNSTEDPDMIRVYDAYGRELFITRQQWRDNVLLGTIEKCWDDADRLAGFIIQSLHDNFVEEMLKPAERLCELQPETERSAVLLAIIYLKSNRLDDSERALQQFIAKHGESGVVLTNFAKVHAERGDDAKTVATLWHALELDPNQDNGLGWYEVLHRDKGGELAGQEALRRVAAIPGSWRAQLWLARADLKAQRLEQAMALYRESLAHAGKPIPTDLLTQMSGDLGNAGHIAEILQVTEPEFDPKVHGVQVGNNLIKANLELSRVVQARKILNQLYALKRPDWREALSFWDTEIAKAGLAQEGPSTEEDIKVQLLVSSGPVWLKLDTPTASLYPAKRNGSPVVSFLGSTAETPNQPDHAQQQLADPPGRMSRALPMFLAEQTEFLTSARTQILVPWVVEPHGAFMLGGKAWDDLGAIEMVQRCEPKSDYVVVTHLNAATDRWVVDFRLLRTTDSQCIGQVTESFPMATPAGAVRQIARRLVAELVQQPSISPQPCPPNYTLPEGDWLFIYLVRLEQMLAVSCNSMDKEKALGLSGERDILDGNLQQCLHIPTSVNVRILFAKTLLYMKDVRPDILPEFSERIAMLQKEKPLAEPAQEFVQKLLDEALAV
jgi:tetratricopeptide (TPR) repeat protein